jgi:signal transduction histidine kinase/ActR/RegA family two-component response regulator
MSSAPGTRTDYQRLFEALPALFIVLGSDFTVLAASDAYLAATASERGEVVGRNLLAILAADPAYHAALRASLERVFATRRPDAMPVQRHDRPRSGGTGSETRHWSPLNVPVFSPAGEIEAIIHRLVDVTDFVVVEGGTIPAEPAGRPGEVPPEIYRRLGHLQQSAEELRAANAQLMISQSARHQANRMEAVGQLTGGVAHDFNNLLTVIVGNIDLLEAEVGEHPGLRKMTMAIRRSADRGARLTRQLLAFSRRQTLRPETCNLNALVLDSDILIKRSAGEAVAVKSQLNPGLWPCNIDPAQFETALLNVIVNAREAMPEGGTLTITTENVTLQREETATIGEVEPGPFVTISVSDTGRGMSGDVARRAFEPFFTTKEIGTGSGLGLSQVYGFVKQSGGHVAISSEVDRGTTVRIYLPRAGRLPDFVEPSKEAPPRLKGSETVLVVEDDQDVLDVAVAALTDLGYRILIAHDGHEALRILERDEPIDLLFTDIVMPSGINGVEVAREARRLRQDIKVLLTSGYSTHALASEFGAAAEFAIITKPYRQTELAEHIRRALTRRDVSPG